MKLKRLPISHCHANCERCGLPTEFRMFESGAGGDFVTYVAKVTRDLYRLDVNKVRSTGTNLKDILSPAYEREGRAEFLMEIPKQVQCKLCGHVFEPTACGLDGEEFVDAYEL